MVRLALALALALAGISLAPGIARAERALASLDDVHTACAEASGPGPRELYVVEVDGPWAFGVLDADGFLAVDTRRNLRALDGSVQLFASGLEPLGVIAGEERAAELEAARERGARLRIGFFLGFDDPYRSSCLVRSRHGVTMVRMDVGFVEILAEDGSVLAREDTERYRAYHDDAETVAGTGPRAAVGAPEGTGVPEGYAAALARVAASELGERLGRCHERGVARGAARTGTVVVRVAVGADGRATESVAAISDLGDEEETACVVEALGAIRWPAAGRALELRIPVRLAD